MLPLGHVVSHHGLCSWLSDLSSHSVLLMPALVIWKHGCFNFLPSNMDWCYAILALLSWLACSTCWNHCNMFKLVQQSHPRQTMCPHPLQIILAACLFFVSISRCFSWPLNVSTASCYICELLHPEISTFFLWWQFILSHGTKTLNLTPIESPRRHL